MASMKRLFLAVWTVSFCLGSALGQSNPVTTVGRQIPAYSIHPPHEQKGFFPMGSRLEILEEQADGMARVRFRSSDGRLIEALCRMSELDNGAPAKPAAPVPVGVKPAGAEYSEKEWLEDSAGHKKALEFQSKYDVPMLIHFYADWNDECKVLWDDLLSTSDFKSRTKSFIKLRINPEHGKEEGLLANRYRLRKYPTTMVLAKPSDKPKYVDLTFWSFGKLRVSKIDYAIADIEGALLPATNAVTSNQ
jgi:hypothetical protein